MSFIKSILAFVALLIVLSSLCCMTKKEKKANLENWLEEKFPGEYVVVNKILDLDLKNLYYRKSTSVVALKSDPDVQTRVEWYKDQPELGIDAEAFKSSMDDAKEDLNFAREIHAALKQQGVEKISVGVIKPAIYFIPFIEPTPEIRQQYLDNILEVLRKQNNPEYGSIWIEVLEDSVYGKEFKNIIPNGHWYRADNWHDQHKIMTLDFEWSPELTSEQLKSGWEFNRGSNRSTKYLEDAYQQAQKWADQNLAKPFYLEGEQMIHIETDQNDPLAVKFSFPYLEEKIAIDSSDFETKIKGYVTGIYQTDQKTFSKIKKVKEL